MRPHLSPGSNDGQMCRRGSYENYHSLPVRRKCPVLGVVRPSVVVYLPNCGENGGKERYGDNNFGENYGGKKEKIWQERCFMLQASSFNSFISFIPCK